MPSRTSWSEFGVIISGLCQPTCAPHAPSALNLRDRERALAGAGTRALSRETQAASGGSGPDLFETYRDAVVAAGQHAKGLTREKLQRAIAKQEAAIKKKYGWEHVDFEVVVSEGRVKLKAAAG